MLNHLLYSSQMNLCNQAKYYFVFKSNYFVYSSQKFYYYQAKYFIRDE